MKAVFWTMRETGLKLRFEPKLQYLIALCLFGTTGLILRWTVLPSEFLVLIRGAGGAVLILLYACLSGRKPSFTAMRNNWKWLVTGGISLGLNWVFLFGAYRHTTVAIASLCNYTAPILVILLSPLLFGERLNAKKLLCVLASAVGIVLVSGAFESGAEVSPAGLLMGMGAAMGFVGILTCNQKLSGISPYDRVVAQLLVAALTVLPYVLIRNWGTKIAVDMPSVLWTLVLVVVHTGIAYCFYFGAMAALPVQTVALWGYLEPVVSVLCSAWILSEPLGVSGILGAVLVLGSAGFSERISN